MPRGWLALVDVEALVAKGMLLSLKHSMHGPWHFAANYTWLILHRYGYNNIILNTPLPVSHII